jgi:hypothetical protein
MGLSIYPVNLFRQSVLTAGDRILLLPSFVSFRFLISAFILSRRSRNEHRILIFDLLSGSKGSSTQLRVAINVLDVL